MSVKLLSFEVSKLKRRLPRLVRVYTRQNASLFEITCRGSGHGIVITLSKVWFSKLSNKIYEAAEKNEDIIVFASVIKRQA